MSADRPDIKIGTRLWKRFSDRMYSVTGETRVSWLVRYEGQPSWTEGLNLPKKAIPEGWMLSEEEWAEFQWALKNRNSICAVSRHWTNHATASQLRQLAALVGWEEKKTA